MKNIIPFKKEVIFKTNISEITSISLEHTLSLENDKVQGNFIVNGEYKGHTYSLMQDKMNGVDDEDFFYRIAMDNVQNARD